jgi:hypothetical protein
MLFFLDDFVVHVIDFTLRAFSVHLVNVLVDDDREA